MRSITAVEIGADICALASTSVHGGSVQVTVAETLDPAAFPGIDAFTLALRQMRRSHGLPRRCRAVVWGLPDGARRRDPAVAPLIEPLTKAGFRVARVVTPCNALGALSRLRTSRNGGAMCWLGINRNGVAIAVIRPGKLLYAHSFAWDSNVGASGSQARLLQRYSLVAFLAPQVRRAVAAAKEKGTTVDGIVTCGNLPDLRSLTMPLIEELDIEVETLDSLEGLQMTPQLADKLAEVAPAIRLACAGALARETRTVDEAMRRRSRMRTRVMLLLRVLALLAILGAAAYVWYIYIYRQRPVLTPVTTPTPKSEPRTTPPSTSPPVASKPSPVVTPSPTNAPAATTPPKAPADSKVTTPAPQPTSAPKLSPAPPATSAPPPSAAASPAPAAKAPAKPGQAVAAPGTARSEAPVSKQPPAAVVTGAAASAAGAAAAVREPLKDPLPRVTAILVSANRRLATVGDEGRIVGVGDTIGRRVVAAIDDRTVLLREPSGLQIRIGLGGRVIGIEGKGRQ